ncbi:Kelch-like protein 38 [Tetrabaena socialis]|uniref:Kelch-like protein 38 n=1 Tax=Tetrabaena socialis TaxID=47790 RepID=A0A2J7ZKT3_9CHLO|nr:Kelch-like protein 38 [Tetrabaena socialis]|eukprot:PNH00873.1 Kelch-like protein 38 [Tetrabaena socialis]
MDLLPHGWLAAFTFKGSTLRLLQLDLQPPSPQSKPEDLTACSWRGDLAGDLGALLQQPSATSDVTVRVGGADCPAHRAILSARCPFFERHFATSLGETSRGPVVELPEADPAAFRHILSYVYTADAGDWADVETAQRVAELADRLLLPKLRDEAAASGGCRAGGQCAPPAGLGGAHVLQRGCAGAAGVLRGSPG